MKLSRKSALLGTAAFALMATQAVAEQRTLKYYADFDPAPLAAFEAAIAEFEAANPDIDVQLAKLSITKATRPRSATSCPPTRRISPTGMPATAWRPSSMPDSSWM
jgi:ABC-type glycerol-3-phosphate transport system substrate-binding protein